MLLKNFYKLLDDYINNDGTDNYFGIDTFNNSIRDEVRSLVIDVIDEEDKMPPDKRTMTDYLFAHDGDVGPLLAIPSDFLRVQSINFVSTIGLIYEPVELVSIEEHYKRSNDLMKPPGATNFMAYISESWMNFTPSPAGGYFFLYYIKDPVVDTVGSESPFLDYFSDSNSEFQALDVADDLMLQGSGTYRDGRTMPFVGTSATKELPIPKEFHLRLFERFIDRLGIKDKDQLTLQYAAMKEQEEKQKN